MNVKRPLNRFWFSPALSTAIFPSIVLLIFRLGFGWDLIVTAWWGHLPIAADMIARFTKWGVPFPRQSFYISAYTELICGGLLMIGIGTRFVSIPVIINFCVACIANPAEITQFFKQNPSNFIEDSAFPFLLLGLLLLAFGAGVFSLDFLAGWLSKKFIRRKT